MMRKYVLLIVAVALLAPAAFAATAVSANTDNVQATVVNQCRVATFALAFGSYDGVVANATTPLDTTAAVNVYCTKGVNPTSLDMGAGSYGAAGVGRKMENIADATQALDYEIYTDSGRTTVWTNNVDPDASASKNTALTAGTTAITAYGRVAANQDVKAGTYRGTIQATVNF